MSEAPRPKLSLLLLLSSFCLKNLKATISSPVSKHLPRGGRAVLTEVTGVPVISHGFSALYTVDQIRIL